MNKLLYKKVMSRDGAFKQAPILKADVVDEEKHIIACMHTDDFLQAVRKFTSKSK